MLKSNIEVEAYYMLTITLQTNKIEHTITI